MLSFRIIAVAVCAFLLSFSSQNAFAVWSGVFRVETSDAGAFGKGSAFAGEADTPAAVYYNPAGLNQIKTIEISAGTAFIGPQADYEKLSGDTVRMRRDTFWIPNVYAVVPINKKLAVGVGATSYFGLGTNWPGDSQLRYDTTKASIMDQDYMLTASYKITDQWSFAAGPDNDFSKANEDKKLAQGSGTDGNFKLKANDDAWGYRIATMYKLNDQHQFGLMYRSRFNHTYTGNVFLNNLDNSSTLYQTIFGGTSYRTKVTDKFTLPQSVVLGYSFKPNHKWTFNFDLEWMDWSSVKHEILNFPDESNATRLAVLTAGNPINHDWNSSWSEAIGAEYAVNDRLRLRGGYYHHVSPIQVNNWDPKIPDADSHGITTGFGYDLNSHLTIDIAYSALLYEPRKINNTLGSPGSVNGKYTQFVNLGLVTLTYKF